MLNQLYTERMERRDKIQIFADIIKTTKTSMPITAVLRKTNVQYNTFKDIIDVLCERGLMSRIPAGKNGSSHREGRTKYIYQATYDGLKWSKTVDEVYSAIRNNIE